MKKMTIIGKGENGFVAIARLRYQIFDTLQPLLEIIPQLKLLSKILGLVKKGRIYLLD